MPNASSKGGRVSSQGSQLARWSDPVRIAQTCWRPDRALKELRAPVRRSPSCSQGIDGTDGTGRETLSHSAELSVSLSVSVRPPGDSTVEQIPSGHSLGLSLCLLGNKRKGGGG
jgi:hypothetical protein